MKFYSKKTIKLSGGRNIELYYANNKGRGSDNVTVMLTDGSPRAGYSRHQQGVIKSYRCSGWKGNVNIDLRWLGINPEEVSHG